MNEQRKGMLAAFAAYAIFGLSFLFSKVALGLASPMVLLCSIISGAVCIPTEPPARAIAKPWPVWKNWVSRSSAFWQ